MIGVVSVRTDLTYQRGVERFWSRKVREEFYYPALAHLGEQVILNKEIFLRPAAAGTNEGAFGYQERFAEYRYKPSRITGLFLLLSLSRWMCGTGRRILRRCLLSMEHLSGRIRLSLVLLRFRLSLNFCAMLGSI